MVKNILVAKNSGFCSGVKKAIDTAFEINEDAHTFGSLVHNEQVVEKLKEKGIAPIENLDNATANTIVIRAHGVSDKIIDDANQRGFNVINTTCSKVLEARDIAKEMESRGLSVVIIGKRGHPEVTGTSQSLVNSIVVESLDAAKSLSYFKSLGVIAQTTQRKELFDEVVNELMSHTDSLEVHNTICYATKDRQDSARDLAKQVELMVIIGGKKSQNTNELVTICKDIVPTVHIQTHDDINSEMFDSIETIGISEGASTPSWITEKVIEKIKSF